MIQAIMKDLKNQLEQVFKPFFNPPATEEEIQKAEKEMGVKFPDELRELYLIHNGEREGGPGLFFGLPFLPLNEVLQEWRTWADLEEEFAFGGDSYSVPARYIKERYINRRWIPISKDYGGNNIGVDIDPDEKGRIGQIINFGRDEEIKYVIAHKLSDFLQFISNMLMERNYQIEQEEDFIYWNYGRENNTHFFDVLQSIELPVLNPVTSILTEESINIWMQQLDHQWEALVQEGSSSPRDFIKKKKLYVIGKTITHIKPLGLCTEVRELILTGNQISDLKPLSSMLFLKKLYLVKNPVSDLTPLANHQYLQQLNINSTKVHNLTPLANLPRLKELEMEETEVNDYSMLQKCQLLESLSISLFNKEQLKQIAKISSLKQLHIHHLKNIEEADLLSLSRLKNLQVITFENCALKNLDCFSSSHPLREIILQDTVVEDGSAIGRLKELKSLTLNGASIHNLEVVAESTSLETLKGSFQQFSLLKELFHQTIDFSTIIGDMTDEEEEVWHQYLEAQRV